jgi:hypothetical protein
MDVDSVQARIEHESAELRSRYPHIRKCDTALVHWTDAEGSHYSLRLDIGWPNHQSLISGPAKDDAGAAIAAAFATARQRVHEAAWASR